MLHRACSFLLLFAFAAAFTAMSMACSDEPFVSRDGGPLDGTVIADRSMTDTIVDFLRSDTQGADARVDVSTADGTVDALAADSTADSTTTGACVQGATEDVLVADEMVGCVVSATPVNQCGAAAHCEPGWHLCTASEYKARYAAADPGLIESLWLAGCVREGAAPFAPSDAVCASCGGGSGGEVAVGWGCVGSISVTSDELNVGVRTSDACGILGVNASANEGYWQPWRASQTLTGALCCK